MTKQLTEWSAKNPAAAIRGIDESVWNALKQTVYPGAKDDTIIMIIDYCRARQLDPILKPVHPVPMYVEDKQAGKKEWRDVVMPGIGLYRIQADRSGTYAGADEPEFGPEITRKLGSVEVTFPQWCAMTVYKLINGERVAFKAKEYWLENYAQKSREDAAPNAMWLKRPYGQLGKCAEAQALRKGWPEIGQEPTAEEMEGKELIIPGPAETLNPALDKALAEYETSIAAIKTGIALNDLSAAAEAWYELPDDVKAALWVAPSKDKRAPFTTHERKVMKDPEFRTSYYGALVAEQDNSEATT